MTGQGQGSPEFDAAYRRALLVALGQTAILPVFAFVLWLLDVELVWPLPDVGVLRILFVAVSAIPFAGVPVVRGGMGIRLAAEDDEAARPAHLMTFSIVQMALFEVPVLLGFALAFLFGSLADFLLLAPVSVAGWLWVFPRPRQWERWLAGEGLVPGGPGDVISRG